MKSGSLQADLAERLAALEGLSQRRALRPSEQFAPDGPPVPEGGNFASNDYLGLRTEHFLKEAAIEALRTYGTGSGASRMICGNHPPHRHLETALADWKGTEAALAFSTGYATALGTIQALVGAQDVIILDKLCHASIIDGARLSGATIRVFPHNNIDRVEALLKGVRERHPGSRVLVVTESVFSMDGDQAPLRELVALKDRYGAWLMVDEAHAAGVFGTHGNGLSDALGIASGVDIQMGTLSKALGCSGGYVCGSRALVDWLVNSARSLIFSTAPPPSTAAAALEAVRWMSSTDAHNRRADLWKNIAHLQRCLPSAGVLQSAIAPLHTGTNEKALHLSQILVEHGLWVPAIRYPTVPRGKARLRITLSAAHSEADIQRLAAALDRAAA